MFILEILGLGAIIYLLSNVSSLRARVDALEKRQGVSASVSPQAVSAPSESVATLEPQSIEPAHTLPPDDVRVVIPNFFTWLREDWLIKLGALLLILGFGWLVSYAFLNNWIGPMGRITLGVVLGTGLLALGWWRMIRFPSQGGIFVVLGATVILLTLFAARALYDFFTPVSAMGMMFLVSAFVALASVKYRRRPLATWGILMAAFVPFLVASHEANYVGLFFYLFIVTLGTLWVVLITGWRNLVVLALGIITLYSIPQWSYQHMNNPLGLDTLTLLGFGFAIVFFVANAFSFLFAREGATRTDILGALWTAVFLVLWIFSGVTKEWQSMILALWTVIFVVGAFLLYSQTGNRKPLITYAGVGVLLLGIATAVELDGAALTIAFILESTAAALLTLLLLRDKKMAGGASVLFAVPILLSFTSIEQYPRHDMAEYGYRGYGYLTQHAPIIHEHFFVLLLLALAFLGLAYVMRRGSAPGELEQHKTQYHAYVIIGSLYAYVLVWLVLHEALVQDTATLLALMCYTIVGLIAYLHGRKNDDRAFRSYGAALLIFVVGRLLLIDVWQMELVGKVITFFLVGTLLMSTAFIGKKK